MKTKQENTDKKNIFQFSFHFKREEIAIFIIIFAIYFLILCFYVITTKCLHFISMCAEHMKQKWLQMDSHKYTIFPFLFSFHANHLQTIWFYLMQKENKWNKFLWLCKNDKKFIVNMSIHNKLKENSLSFLIRTMFEEKIIFSVHIESDQFIRMTFLQ